MCKNEFDELFRIRAGLLQDIWVGCILPEENFESVDGRITTARVVNDPAIERKICGRTNITIRKLKYAGTMIPCDKN